MGQNRKCLPPTRHVRSPRQQTSVRRPLRSVSCRIQTFGKRLPLITVVPERGAQALRPQSEQFALAEHMTAEGPNRNRTCSGNNGGRHDVATEHSTQGLHSADFIHCRADHSKVETVRGTNVAVEHFTTMEGDVEIEWRFTGDGSGSQPRCERLPPALRWAARTAAAPAAFCGCSSVIGKMARRPSPRNFNTSPP
jgi:hypothetical protein